MSSDKKGLPGYLKATALALLLASMVSLLSAPPVQAQLANAITRGVLEAGAFTLRGIYKVTGAFFLPAGTTLPSTCDSTVSGARRLFLNTTDNQFYSCSAPNTWTAMSTSAGIPNPLTVNQGFTGNNSHSGSEGFTGPVTTKVINGVLNAAQFAVGSSTGGIAEAIAYCVANGCAAIDMPEGTYSASVTITVNKSDLILRGRGDGTVVVNAASGAVNLFLVGSGTNRVTFQNFKIDGQKGGAHTSGRGISMSNADDVMVDGMYITNTAGACVGTANGGSGTANRLTVKNSRLDGCGITAGADAYGIQLSGAPGSKLIDNKISDAYTAIFGFNSSSDVLVRGNRITAGRENGIRWSSSRWIVTDNFVDGVAVDSIRADGAYAIVSNNTLTNGGNSGIKTDGNGDPINTGVLGSIWSGNYIKGMANRGIAIGTTNGPVTNLTVDSNRVESSTGDGIQLASGGSYAFSRVSIVANDLISNGFYGLAINAAPLASTVAVRANKYSANSLGDYSFTPTLWSVDLEQQDLAPLVPGRDHTCAILGDSVGAETPYYADGGMTWPLMTKFAADAAYTQKVGSDLATTPGTLRNATYDSPSDTVTMTSCSGGGCPVNFGATYKADFYFDSPDIDISANPTSRYLLEYDVDTSGLKQANYSPNPPNPNADLLSVYIRAVGAGCGTDADFIAFDGTGGSSLHPIHALRRAADLHYAMVLDPKDWDIAGNDYSGGTKFGNGTCKMEPSFVLVTDYSNASVVVKVKNIKLTRLAYSTKWLRWATGSQTTPGVNEDDYPTLKTKHITGKTRPVDCAVLVSGRNDYDAQSGTYSGGASTIANYFSTLTTLGNSMASDGIAARVKVLPFPSTHAADSTQIWGYDSFEGSHEGWKSFILSEREFLMERGLWKFIDTSRWGEYSPVPKLQTMIIPASMFPGAGGTNEFAITINPDFESSLIVNAQIVSDTTVAQDGANKYCFSVWNKTLGLQITSADVCTNTTAMNAYNVFLMSVAQNLGINANNRLTLKMTRTGNPATAPSHLLVQYVLQNSTNMNPVLMYDTQHASQMGYRYLSEAIYETLTGKGSGYTK